MRLLIFCFFWYFPDIFACFCYVFDVFSNDFSWFYFDFFGTYKNVTRRNAKNKLQNQQKIKIINHHFKNHKNIVKTSLENIQPT